MSGTKESFRYDDVIRKGKPQHDKLDPFRVRHPEMDVNRRAKIFSPFDALKGFGNAISEKNTLYVEVKELSAEDRAEIDRRLHILKNLTWSTRMARMNRVHISVTHYVMCADENSEAFGIMGQYQTTSGICLNIDDVSQTILIDSKRIELSTIISVESSDGIFDKTWDV